MAIVMILIKCLHFIIWPFCKDSQLIGVRKEQLLLHLDVNGEQLLIKVMIYQVIQWIK